MHPIQLMQCIKCGGTFPNISSFRCLHESVVFPKALLYGTVDYLKYSRGSFPPQTSYLCAFGSLTILESLIILEQGPKPLGVLRSLASTYIIYYDYIWSITNQAIKPKLRENSIRIKIEFCFCQISIQICNCEFDIAYVISNSNFQNYICNISVNVMRNLA